MIVLVIVSIAAMLVVPSLGRTAEVRADMAAYLLRSDMEDRDWTSDAMDW